MEPIATQTTETMSQFAAARSFIVKQQVNLETQVEGNIGAAGTKELLALSLFAVCLSMVCAILAFMDLVETLYEVSKTVQASEQVESIKTYAVHYFDEAIIAVHEWYESIGTSSEEVEIAEQFEINSEDKI